MKNKGFENFGQAWQLSALKLLTKDIPFAQKVKITLDPEYFDNKYCKHFAQLILNHLTKYQIPPDLRWLEKEVKTEHSEVIAKTYLAILSEIENADITRAISIEDEMQDFCYKRYAMMKHEEERALIELGLYDKARLVAFERYKPISISGKEFDLKRDYKRVLDEIVHYPVPTPFPTFNEKSQGGPGRGDLCLVIAPSNFGKCWERGTLIRMCDMSLKKIEDIRIGDKVMGHDGTSRTVEVITSGQEMMYKINQNNGDSYTVNESHILVLKPTKNYLKRYPKMTEELVKIEVKDYVLKSNFWKANHKGIKVGIDTFEYSETGIEPYFLGLWLGDGRSSESAIYSADSEIEDYLKSYADKLSFNLHIAPGNKNNSCIQFRITDNINNSKHSLKSLLKEYNLLHNKHIPKNYLINSRKTRLEVLAGLLDTAGYLDKTTKTNFEISTISDQLAEDIVFLGRSLGFKVQERKYQPKMKRLDGSIYTGNAWKIIISGDTYLIPTKIERKRAIKRKSNKSPLSTSITATKLKIDTYYGFTIDSKDPDRMFLLKDFTIVHNTAYLTAVARHAAICGKNVMYFSLETKGEQIARRAIAGLIHVNQENLDQHPGLIDQEIAKLKGNVRILQLKATEAYPEVLALKMEEAKADGFFPEIVCVDSINQLKTPKGSKFESTNHRFEWLAEWLRDFGNDYSLPVHAALQTNRSGFNADINDEQSIGKAIEPFQVADLVITFAQSVELESIGQARANFLKNRLGPKGMIIRVSYDPNQGLFKEEFVESKLALYNEKERNDAVKSLTNVKETLLKRRITNPTPSA
jgi:replicative DNA helicase